MWKYGYYIEKFITIILNKICWKDFITKYKIIVYHNVTESNNENKKELANDTVTINEFEKQMQFLRENNYNMISLSEISKIIKEKKDIPERTVVITFDDGYRNIFKYAYPILLKYKIPATIFLATGYIGTNKPFPWLNSIFLQKSTEDHVPMNWDEVLKLYEGGIEIGSHTVSHKFLPKMDSMGIEKELLDSQLTIEDKIGIKTLSAALPFSYPIDHPSWSGFKQSLIKSLLKGGYTSCCTMIRGESLKNNKFLFLNRIPILKNDNLRYFSLKINGFYSWTSFLQYIYQLYFKKYDF